MKRINSFMLAAVAIFAAASCQKEMANEPLQNEGGDFTVTATTVADTKTVLDDVNNIIYWAPGDQISLFDTSGAEVVFSTDITTNQTKANFTNDTEFDAPSSLLAVYPTRTDKTTTYDAANNTIRTLHIGGVQNALAGGFDSRYAVAVGTPKTAGSTELEFNNIHTLIKFTVGGETAPNTVTLKNNGVRPIAGNFDYDLSTNTTTMTAGEPKITLNGPFEVGKTYYIAMTPGICGGGISLEFDGIVVKNTGETKTLMPNKIYNLGTLEAPEQTISATSVLAKQSGATSYMTEFGGTADKDRNIAIDADYLYIPETTSAATMWKIALADGTASKMPVETVNGGGTFALCCPRIIANEDATINSGKDVLVVSNMGMDGGNTVLYVYNNGINSNPTKLDLNTAWMGRRVGDKFSMMSTNNGVTTLLMKDANSGALLTFNLTLKNGSVSCTEATSRTYLVGNWDHSGVGGFYVYPGASLSEGLYTSTNKGTYVVKDDATLTADNKATYLSQWDNQETFKGCHGFQFFKLGGKDYIAYTNYTTKTLNVIKGTANAAGVKSALEANEVVWSTKIAANNNTQNSGNSGADCAIHVIDANNVLVAGHVQNVGVVVYRLSVE